MQTTSGLRSTTQAAAFRACPVPAGERRAEMEVGEMCDAKTVEPNGQPLDLHVEHAGTQPAGFEPSVDDARDDQTHENGAGTSTAGD